MKKIILSILLALVGSAIWASTIPTNIPEYKAIVRSRTDKVRSISDEAKFYLVTCAPGDEIYERFGHSGIRVCDPINEIDEVFHWGLFSFDTPNFIGRFISGNTDYEMGVYSTRFFKLQYIDRGSAIYAQELDLTTEQKHAMWAKLWNNYRPENRKYRYNFIYDNCATRPLQLIFSAYDNKISSEYELQQTTYRDIINKYVPVGSAFNTGINLIIGNSADKCITAMESAAFPVYTMETLGHTNYITEDGLKSIVKQQEIMHAAVDKNFEVSTFVFYASIFIPLVLAFLCSFLAYKKQRYVPCFTQLMLFISGLVGVIIGFLWFFSHHPLVDNNINILWCNPLNIILAILLCIRHKALNKIKLIMAIISYILALVFLILIAIGVQETTMQIFAIWILMLAINRTIVSRYNLKKVTLNR